MTVLTGDQIASAPDSDVSEALPVPEWGGDVHLRNLTSGGRDGFILACCDPQTGRVRADVTNFTAYLLALTLCDAEGNLLFPDFAVGRVTLAGRSGTVCDRLFEVATTINKLDSDAIAASAKNLPETPSDDSPTDSAST